MTWFKVDDRFHSHPKAVASSAAALGLWVIAGSWSSANLTNGFVSDRVLPRLLPDAATLANELVEAGLWTRTRGGYQFHDWSTYQPTREEVDTTREKWRTDKARQRRTRHPPSSEEAMSTEDTSVDSQVESGKSLRGVFSSRPDPETPKGVSRGGASAREAPRSHSPPSEARQQAEVRAKAISACNLCDETGYVQGKVCDHDPEALDRAARGRVAVSAAMQRKGTT